MTYVLATRPDIQQKMRDEIESVIENIDEIDHTSISNLPYVEACIKVCQWNILYPHRIDPAQFNFYKRGVKYTLPIIFLRKFKGFILQYTKTQECVPTISKSKVKFCLILQSEKYSKQLLEHVQKNIEHFIGIKIRAGTYIFIPIYTMHRRKVGETKSPSQRSMVKVRIDRYENQLNREILIIIINCNSMTSLAGILWRGC